MKHNATISKSLSNIPLLLQILDQSALSDRVKQNYDTTKVVLGVQNMKLSLKQNINKCQARLYKPLAFESID